MKKVGWLLVCAMLTFVLAVPVHANDTLPEGDTNQVQTDNTESTLPSEPQGTVPETQPPHVHEWESWTAAGEKHVRICKGCNASEEAEHSYDSWQDKGTDHSKTCTVCAHTVTEAHNRSSSTVLKPPTCKEEGKLGKICAVCSSVQEESIPKLKTHTYDSACDSECNVCGIKRDVLHEFETVWVKDSTGHWYACTKCDEKVAFSKHNPGPEATEEKEQLCTTCKYVIKPKVKHSHSFEKKWTTDESGHWHACKTCDVEDSYAAHVYDDVCDIDCNICDYEKEQGHTYDDDWKTSKWEHWQICTVCGEESKHEKHISGPEATEKEAQVCTACGYELTPVQIHSHDFSQEWEWDTVNHWQVCSCGETSVEMEHIWDQGREVRKGVLERTCTQCDATKLERKEAGFPWMILLVILALGCLGGIVVLVVMLKRGAFEEEADADEADDTLEVSEELAAEEVTVDMPEDEKDPEIDMIDAFFSSLDKE